MSDSFQSLCTEVELCSLAEKSLDDTPQRQSAPPPLQLSRHWGSRVSKRLGRLSTCVLGTYQYLRSPCTKHLQIFAVQTFRNWHSFCSHWSEIHQGSSSSWARPFFGHFATHASLSAFLYIYISILIHEIKIGTVWYCHCISLANTHSSHDTNLRQLSGAKNLWALYWPSFFWEEHWWMPEVWALKAEIWKHFSREGPRVSKVLIIQTKHSTLGLLRGSFQFCSFAMFRVWVLLLMSFSLFCCLNRLNREKNTTVWNDLYTSVNSFHLPWRRTLSHRVLHFVHCN